jgi:hypothetical protein
MGQSVCQSADQAAFEAWTAGGRVVAQMVTEGTLETESLREKLLAISISK